MSEATAMEGGERPKLASPASYIVHSHNISHQFVLADMPQDLCDALKEYDLDGDGAVTVAEIAAGARLLRKQADKVRGRFCHWLGGTPLVFGLLLARCRTRWRRLLAAAPCSASASGSRCSTPRTT